MVRIRDILKPEREGSVNMKPKQKPEKMNLLGRQPKLGASKDVASAVAKAMSKAAVVFSEDSSLDRPARFDEEEPPEWVSKLAREAAKGGKP